MAGKEKAKSAPIKLSKKDPDFYSKIAKLAGKKLRRKYGKGYFSKLAKKSHPRKDGYHGGRPKKVKAEDAGNKTTKRSRSSPP